MDTSEQRIDPVTGWPFDTDGPYLVSAEASPPLWADDEYLVWLSKHWWPEGA